jgi:bacterial/archaeal transporter family protein
MLSAHSCPRLFCNSKRVCERLFSYVMKHPNFYLSIAVTLIVLSGLPLLEKVTLGKINPQQMAFLRGLSQVAIYAGVLYATGGFGGLQSASPKYIVYGLLQGVAIAVMIYFYFSAMKSEQVSLVTALTATSPMLTYLLAVLFLHEPLTFARGLGIMFVILGVILLR